MRHVMRGMGIGAGIAVVVAATVAMAPDPEVTPVNPEVTIDQPVYVEPNVIEDVIEAPVPVVTPDPVMDGLAQGLADGLAEEGFDVGVHSEPDGTVVITPSEPAVDVIEPPFPGWTCDATGCVAPDADPIPREPHEDEPGFDCRVHGNEMCGVQVHGMWYLIQFEDGSPVSVRVRP